MSGLEGEPIEVVSRTEKLGWGRYLVEWVIRPG